MSEYYVLCYKGITKDGKEDIYQIYKSKLEYIDMYTSYKNCYSKKDLFALLPQNVKNSILKNFNENDYGYIKGDFFIRKNCKNIRRGRTNLEVIYSKDADIIYANSNDILLNLYSIRINDNDSLEVVNIKRDFFKKLSKIIFDDKSLAYFIDVNNERFLYLKNRTSSLNEVKSNLNIITNYLFKKDNYNKKREVLFLLKQKKIQLDNLNNKKTTFMDEKRLEEKQERRKFSIMEANNIINKIKKIEDNYFDLKYPKENKKEEIKKHDTMHEDDIDYTNIPNYEDDCKDDFLGPTGPNDPMYWSIN